MPGPQAHAVVHGGRRHARLLHEPDRVEEVGEEQAVDDEAGRVRHLDRGLVERSAPGPRPVGQAVARALRNAELDQLHARDRVEDVKAEDAIGRSGAVAEVGDRERRGRGREVGVRRRLRERGEELALRVGVLGDRLDDQVAAGELLLIGRHLDVAGDRALELSGCLLGLFLGPPRRGVRAREKPHFAERRGAGGEAAGDRAAARNGGIFV